MTLKLEWNQSSHLVEGREGRGTHHRLWALRYCPVDDFTLVRSFFSLGYLHRLKGHRRLCQGEGGGYRKGLNMCPLKLLLITPDVAITTHRA